MTSFSDAFTRSNDTSGLGSNWLCGPATNAMQINSNQCSVVSTSNIATAVTTAPASSSPDSYAEVAMGSSLVGSGGPFCRSDSSASDYYHLRINSTTSITLGRVIAGTRTTVATFTVAALVSGDVVKITASGTGAAVALEAFVNGVSAGTYSDTNAARILTGTYAGIRHSANSSGMKWDNFAAGDLSSSTLHEAAGTLTMTGTISGTGKRRKNADGALSVGVGISGTGKRRKNADGALSVGVGISGVGDLGGPTLHEAAGSRSVAVGITGTGKRRKNGDGTLGVGIGFTGAAKRRKNADGTLNLNVGALGVGVSTHMGAYTHDVTWVSGNLSGTIGLGLGESTTWTVPDVMDEFPGQANAPIVITVVTKSAGIEIGRNQVTLFAREAPEAPIAWDTSPTRQFDIRAREVTFVDDEWTAKRSLKVAELSFVAPASATATCSITLSDLNVDGFPDYSIIDTDTYDGDNWNFTNHRFVLSRIEGDSIDPARTRTYSGTEFVDYMLGFAHVPNEYVWGEVGFAAATTPGEMMRWAIEEAQTTGWGPRIDFDFTAAKTSLGESWANTGIKRRIAAGTPLIQMLSGLVEDGLVEYRTEYRDNKAFLVLLNPGTGLSYADTGSDPVVNLSLAQLASAPRRASIEQLLTRVTVVGDDKVRVTRQKAPFDEDVFGQLGGWVAASGVTTNEAATVIGDNALRDNSSPVNERTFEFKAQSVAPHYYPFGYVPGDWVLIPNEDTDSSVKDRISQITVAKTLDGTSITVLTGDRILGGTASLAKRQSAQTGGSIAGGNQTSPNPVDSRIPNAPTISGVTSEGYWDSDGAARSAVTLEWTAVTTALNGSNITVDLYEVYSRPAGIGAEWSLRTATADLSVVIGGWDVLEEIEFRVRGRSSAGIYGEFSENEEHTTAAPPVDLDGPDLADLYTDGVGNIFAVWGGYLDGSPAPARLAYVVAEISTDGVVFTTTGTPITAAGQIVVNPGAWGDYTVRLRGYDRLGNAGSFGNSLTVTLTDPHIDPRTPVAPDNLSGTAGAGWDSTGALPTAWVDLEWDAPTVDTLGDPVNIIGYDVWGRPDTETEMRFLTSVTVPEARWTVKQGESWSFQVTAASEYGAVSAPSDAIVVVADATVAAPAAPAAPTLSQYAGIIRVNWSGNGMVPQVKYAFAAISTVSGGPYDRVGAALQGQGEVVVSGQPTGLEYFAVIILVDELGNMVSSPESDGMVLLPITGVTIQTSEDAETGIKLTNGGLTAYNALGEPTFVIDAGTGHVTISAYEDVFEFGAVGVEAETGDPTTGLAISSEDSSFNTFIHAAGVQIRNDQDPLSWWEADETDAGNVNFVSPRANITNRLKVGDLEAVVEIKAGGATRLVYRYKGV